MASLLFHYISRAPTKLRKMFFSREADRLHIGSGPNALQGWVNIDNARYPGVRRMDVAKGLPFKNVRFIFAEHFIEHLHYNDARYFLRECRRVLRDDGVLRLSTPNLDWVWAIHYGRDLSEDRKIAGAFELNRAFRGWGHQFLYNFSTLAATLREAGFAEVAARDYGESPHDELRGLEQHDRDPDAEGLPHILIVEARGRGGETPPALAPSREQYLRDVAVR